MSKRDETDIHRPDGALWRGEKLGEVDGEGTIRKPSGVFSRGEQVGYVDSHGLVRKPDPFFGKGEAVGQVKGTAAHELDGVFWSGEQWGYVDDKGNIRQRDGAFWKGRIIGRVRGSNQQAALGYYVLRFRKIEEQAAAVEKEADDPKSRRRALGRVRRMLEWVPQAEALGDFDGLLGRLRRIEARIESAIAKEQSAQRAKKEQLIERAEKLAAAREWKEAAAALRGLHEAWKQVGTAGREEDEHLWERFRAAHDRFYARRTEHFAAQEREREHNRRRKETLCERAEALVSASDASAATQRAKELQQEWRGIGPAGREVDDALWARFRHASDRVFQRASAEHERRRAEGRTKMREALGRKREQAGRLRESIEHDRLVIVRWEDTIGNLRPGARAEEIRSSLWHKISEVSEKVASKFSRLRELEEAIADIRGKLGE